MTRNLVLVGFLFALAYGCEDKSEVLAANSPDDEGRRATAPSPPKAENQYPPLQVLGDQHLSLGLVVEGSIWPTSFCLKNSSESRVSIESVEPTCGCTVVGLGGEEGNRGAVKDVVLEPGAVTIIDTVTDTIGKRGAANVVIHVRTSPPEASIELSIGFDAQPQWEISPPVQEFGARFIGQSVATKCTISSNLLKDFTLSAPEGELPRGVTVAVRANPNSPDSKLSWEVEVTLPPNDVSVGRELIKIPLIANAIKSVAGREVQPHRVQHPQIIISGRTAERFAAVPEYVALGLTKPGEPARGATAILARDFATSEVLEEASVEWHAQGSSLIPFARAEAHLLKAVDGWSLEVLIPKIDPTFYGAYRGAIELRTSSGVILAVPVFGIVGKE